MENARRERLSSAGTWLRRTRERRGYSTVRAFAAALGVDPAQVSNYETGKNAVSEDRAEEIARVLRMSIIEVRRGLGLWTPDDDGQNPQPLSLQDIPTEDLFQELERRFQESERTREKAAES